MSEITPGLVRELHEARFGAGDGRGASIAVLTRDSGGKYRVEPMVIAGNNGRPVIAEQAMVVSWADGQEMTDSDYEQLAAEMNRSQQEAGVSTAISDERIAEIRALLEADLARGYDDGGNPFHNVIAGLPEFDGEATAARYDEAQDMYVLTDGTVLDGEREGWRIIRPAASR